MKQFTRQLPLDLAKHGALELVEIRSTGRTLSIASKFSLPIMKQRVRFFYPVGHKFYVFEAIGSMWGLQIDHNFCTYLGQSARCGEMSIVIKQFVNLFCIKNKRHDEYACFA